MSGISAVELLRFHYQHRGTVGVFNLPRRSGKSLAVRGLVQRLPRKCVVVQPNFLYYQNAKVQYYSASPPPALFAFGDNLGRLTEGLKEYTSTAKNPDLHNLIIVEEPAMIDTASISLDAVLAIVRRRLQPHFLTPDHTTILIGTPNV